jgi:hypothetical protein
MVLVVPSPWNMAPKTMNRLATIAAVLKFDILKFAADPNTFTVSFEPNSHPR